MIQNMRNIIFILSIFLGSATMPIWGQNPDSLVWPGDVNNNGLVNHLDVLYMGAAYGTQGPVRNNSTISWNGWDTPQNWGGAFGNGVSFAFADCNGDGEVNTTDLQAIQVNYDLQHDALLQDDFLVNPNLEPTALLFDSTGNIPAVPGEFLSIPISLGTDNTPIDDFYGLAFTIEVNTEYVDLASVTIDFEQSWLDPNAEGLLQLQKRVFNENIVEVAVSRRTMTNSFGEGVVANVNFVIIDDLPDFAPETEVLTIKNVLVVDNQLSVNYEATGSSLYLDFTNKLPELPQSDFSIYPNPVEYGVLHIQGLELYPSANVQMFDLMGRRVEARLNDQDMNVSHLPTGIYILNISTDEGQLSEKIMITN